MNLFVYYQNWLSVLLLIVACLSLQTCDGKRNKRSRSEKEYQREPNFRENWTETQFPSFQHNRNPYSARITQFNGSPSIWSPHPQNLPQVWSPKVAMTSPLTELPKVLNAGSEMPLNSMASATMYNLWLISGYLRLMAANALQNINAFNNFSAKPMNSFNQQMSSGLSSESTVSPLLAFISKLIEHQPNDNLSFLNQDVAENEDDLEVTLETPELLSSAEGIESQIYGNNSIGNVQPQGEINDNGDVDNDSEMQVEDVTEEFEEDDENEVSEAELPKQQLHETNNNQAEIIKTQGQQEKDVSGKENQLKQQLHEINKNQTVLLK